MDQRQIDQRHNHHQTENQCYEFIKSNLCAEDEFNRYSPLNDLWILCANDHVANSWKAGDVDGLMPKAKVAKIQAQRQSESMPDIC